MLNLERLYRIVVHDLCLAEKHINSSLSVFLTVTWFDIYREKDVIVIKEPAHLRLLSE